MVFDEDANLYATIIHLIKEAKCPIVLTCEGPLPFLRQVGPHLVHSIQFPPLCGLLASAMATPDCTALPLLLDMLGSSLAQTVRLLGGKESSYKEEVIDIRNTPSDQILSKSGTRCASLDPKLLISYGLLGLGDLRSCNQDLASLQAFLARQSCLGLSDLTSAFANWMRSRCVDFALFDRYACAFLSRLGVGPGEVPDNEKTRSDLYSDTLSDWIELPRPIIMEIQPRALSFSPAKASSSAEQDSATIRVKGRNLLLPNTPSLQLEFYLDGRWWCPTRVLSDSEAEIRLPQPIPVIEGLHCLVPRWCSLSPEIPVPNQPGLRFYSLESEPNEDETNIRLSSWILLVNPPSGRLKRLLGRSFPHLFEALMAEQAHLMRAPRGRLRKRGRPRQSLQLATQPANQQLQENEKIPNESQEIEGNDFVGRSDSLEARDSDDSDISDNFDGSSPGSAEKLLDQHLPKRRILHRRIEASSSEEDNDGDEHGGFKDQQIGLRMIHSVLDSHSIAPEGTTLVAPSEPVRPLRSVSLVCRPLISSIPTELELDKLDQLSWAAEQFSFVDCGLATLESHMEEQTLNCLATERGNTFAQEEDLQLGQTIYATLLRPIRDLVQTFETSSPDIDPPSSSLTSLKAASPLPSAYLNYRMARAAVLYRLKANLKARHTIPVWTDAEASRCRLDAASKELAMWRLPALMSSYRSYILAEKAVMEEAEESPEEASPVPSIPEIWTRSSTRLRGRPRKHPSLQFTKPQALEAYLRTVQLAPGLAKPLPLDELCALHQLLSLLSS